MKLSVFAVVSLLVAAARAACPYNGCSCSNTKVNCNHRGLTSMPALNAGSYGQTVLDISRNSFTDIPDGSIKGGLQTFETWFTPLMTVGDHALDASAGSLKRAIIERHNLTAIPKTFASMGGQFIYLHLPWGQISDVSTLSQMQGGLKFMEMRGNRISDVAAVEAGMNKHKNTLVRAWFMHNMLDRVPNTYSGFSHFLEWGLDSNNISDVPANTMARTTTVIKMRDNKLTKIPTEFQALTKLWDLLLDGNQISSIDDYHFNPVLTNLHLRRNNIQSINRMQFPGGHTRLRWVQLGDNPLTYIAPGAFSQAREIRQLGLSNTLLTRLPAQPVAPLNKLIIIYFNHCPNLECHCTEKSMSDYYYRRGTWQMDIGGICANTNETVAHWLHETGHHNC